MQDYGAKTLTANFVVMKQKNTINIDSVSVL